jgi:hypothetical protein
MEDDVTLPHQYTKVKMSILDFLTTRNGKWDVFAGLIAELPRDVAILSVDDSDGIRFVTISNMVSTVWNIYSKEAMSFLAIWDPHNQDAQTNTLDRYLSTKEDLKVVVTLPFLFGHNSDLNSTLWNFQNDVYDQMIANTESKLQYLVDEYLNLNSI